VQRVYSYTLSILSTYGVRELLDYGYRSLCCAAPLRLSKKTIKKREIKVWACTKCKKNDVAIIPKNYPQSQDEFRFEQEIPDVEDS
jgi:ribosomal protein L37AE/L43A